MRGREIIALYEDFGNLELRKAASAAHKFTSVDKVNVLISMWSEDTEVVLPIAERSNTVTVSIAAGAKGLPQKSPLLFRVWPSDETMAEAVVNHAIAAGAQRAVIIVQQTAYHEAQKDLIVSLWDSRTAARPLVISIPSAQADFRAEVTRIRREQPQAVFVQLDFENGGLFVRQLCDAGQRMQVYGIIGSDEANFLKAAGAAAEGVIFPRYEPGNPEYAESFRMRYGKPLGVPAENAYDAVMLRKQPGPWWAVTVAEPVYQSTLPFATKRVKFPG